MLALYPTSYFANSYFPPAYFDPGTPTHDNEPVVESVRDSSAYETILVALRSTSVFSDVNLTFSCCNADDLNSNYPSITIIPLAWVELDDATNGRTLRKSNYTMKIGVRSTSNLEGFKELERIERSVRTVVVGSDHGIECVQELSRLKQGKIEHSADGRLLSLILSGEFAYVT